MFDKLLMDLLDYEKSLLEDPTSVDPYDSRLQQLNHFLDWFLYRDETIPLTEMDLKVAKKVLEVASLIYNTTGNRIMSDEKYDRLYDLYDPLSRGNDIVGSPNGEGMKTEKHRYPDLKGTLSKIYSLKSGELHNTGVKKPKRSLEEWIGYIENKLGRSLTAQEAKVMIQPKYDGVSVVVSFDGDGKMIQALTRGDKDTGEGVVVTDAFSDLQLSGSGPAFPCGVKTEVIMPFDQFEEAKRKYGYLTPLSAVSGIINGTNGRSKEDMKLLQIRFLRYQGEGSSDIELITDPLNCDSDIIPLTDMDRIQKELNRIDRMRELLPIDGAVFILVNKDLQRILGRENDRCVYEVAYKFPPEEKKSTLVDVVWQTGLLGNLTPVAKVKPVEIRGKTISSISLGSVDRFKSLDLHEGDEVVVKYDVIPYMETVPQNHQGSPFALPTHCDVCGEALKGESSNLKCPNAKCPSKKKGKILNFIRKVGIADISDATVEFFYEKGYVTEIWQLYDLHEKADELMELPGFGERSVENLLKEIEKHRTLRLHEFLGSIGIPKIGRRTFEKITEHYGLAEIQAIAKESNLSKLTTIKGISDATALAIIDGLNENEKLIKKMLKRIEIDESKYSFDYHTTVYFTKCRDPKFAEFLKLSGVMVSENYTRDTDYLIIKDKNSDSKKIGKYNVPVLTLSEAFDFFKYQP